MADHVWRYTYFLDSTPLHATDPHRTILHHPGNTSNHLKYESPYTLRQGLLIIPIHLYGAPGFPGFFEVDFALLFRVGSILFGDERKGGRQLSFITVYRLQLTLQQGDNIGDM